MAENWLTKKNAHGFSLGDALYAWGGMLKGDADPVGDLTRRMDARKQEAAFADLAGMFGGGATPSPVLAGGQGVDTLAGGAGSPRPTGWSVMDQPKALTDAGVGGAGNPGGAGGMTPEQRQKLFGYYSKTKNLDGLLKLWSMDQPTYERGEDGFYEFRPGQAPKLVSRFAEKPEKQDVPSGMEIGPDGKLQWRPGYVEAQKLLGDVRRDILLEKPLPVRSGGGRGGGRASPSGSTGLPPGFTPD